MTEEDELFYINEKYESIFEDIKLFEEQLCSLPSPVATELRMTFSRILGSISQCHRELATMAKNKIESMKSDVNYLIFDLEATKRERDEYKRKMD